MNIEDRIKALVKLGNDIENIIQICLEKTSHTKKDYASYIRIIESEQIHNGWFTKENIINSMRGIREWLIETNLRNWIKNYYKQLSNSFNQQDIGVIMAGNIPLVSFHDILSVIITGNRLRAKISSQDKNLPIMLFDMLKKINPEFDKVIFVEERLTKYDKVIATGTNNASKYFQTYFGNKPMILRKHRNSIAILDGTETDDMLCLLADDIFQYFGLGCRNVSKIYLPKGYDIDQLFRNFHKYNTIIHHNKYANNYNYYRTIYMMSQIPFFDNDFAILKNDKSLDSPVSVVNFEYYNSLNDVNDFISSNKNALQCLISNNSDIANVNPFGTAQTPLIEDYADGINTLEFLTD